MKSYRAGNAVVIYKKDRNCEVLGLTLSIDLLMRMKGCHRAGMSKRNPLIIIMFYQTLDPFQS